VPTQAAYFRDEDGREPVREFLRSTLDPQARRLVKNQIEQMNKLRDDLPPLPFPITSQIEGGLRELRCHSGSALYRVLYRRSDNLFILLHMIRKDSSAVPRRDVQLAQRRWRDYKRRMDTPERRGRRPVGKDAP
jgi:phage-related protein